MAGFGGSTGVSKGYVDGAIAQSMAGDKVSVNISSTESVSFHKTGRMVIATVSSLNSVTIPAWGNTVLCAIPDGFQPTANVRFLLPRQNTTDFIPAYFTALGNKELRIENQSGVSVTTGAILSTALVWSI